VKVVEDAGPFVVNNSRIELAEPISQLRIESEFVIDKSGLGLVGERGSPTVDQVRRAALAMPDLSEYGPAPYLFASRLVRIEPAIGIWAGEFIAGDQPIVAMGMALMGAIYSEFKFDSKATQADTPPIEAFRKRRGVCQDFAQIMIIALRAHGIPAAYVSGYLRTRPPPGSPRLIGADATHAWVNIWCGPDLGWVGFDPTNNAVAQHNHIFTAMGRDYADVAPIDGVFYGQSGQHVKVSVDVRPIEAGVGELQAG
ncbi:MAG: transglutaminase family protein, partial [Hyphomicrobiales bacterium]